MSVPAPRRVVLYSPDRARPYDGRVRERRGVGGGITARLSLLEALARLGHDVRAIVHCESPISHEGVSYVPLAEAGRIEADILIAISTGGALTFAPMRDVAIDARLRLLWVQGVPKPAQLDAVRPDHTVTASRFLQQVCIDRWRLPAGRVFTVHNGIHQQYFRDVERDPPPRDPFALAYVGPPEKGLDACVEVLRRLRRDDDRFRLDVYGGSPLWGGDADPDPGEPGLRFMGLLGQRDLTRALFGYEYCLVLQAMEEGFGIAAQEARRAGAIVIASAVGAFPELFEHGRTGYLVRGSHTTAAVQDETARLIQALTDAPLRRDRIRRRAPDTPFDWDAAAREWTAHWDRLLAGHAPDSPNADRAVAPRPSVFIAGYYGHRNLGDEAILDVLVREIEEARPDVTIAAATADPAGTEAAHDLDTVDDTNIAAIGSAIRDSALVILGGGGLLHDHFGVDEDALLTPRQWGLAQCAGYAALAAHAGRPFMLGSIGAGPLTSGDAQRLARLVTASADTGTVRDAESLALLTAIGAPIGQLQVAADPAWLLPPAPAGRARRVQRRFGIPDETRPVAVALRSWDIDADADAWESAMAGALDALIDAGGWTALFVPFQSGADPATDDAAAAARVSARMQHAARVRCAPAGLSPSLVQAIFGECSIVLAMRLHAVILAANAGAPFVAVRYDDKMAHAASALGLGEFVVDLPSLTPDGLADRLQSAVLARDRIQMMLGTRLPALRASAALTARVASDTIGRCRATASPASAEWTTLMNRAARALAGDARPSPRAATPAGVARRLARRVLPAPWRRALRERWYRRRLSPPAALFARYRQERIRRYGASLAGVQAPGEAGLVSVVLPVWNGAALLAEAVESVLAQTHRALELIIVNDGSSDDTGVIADRFAARDARVRVVHQDNRKLPAALNRGFDLARGEFLTWTSCDNRLRPGALASLVACLQRHPDWEVAYGDMDLIGEDGRPLVQSAEFASYQSPHGSAHIRLPADTSELNTRANNFIGAGFLYRSRTAALLGRYGDSRFGVEDYDFWMRANALLQLRHADVDDTAVEYRFHGASLTARADALDVPAARDRLMVFDRFRRDLYLAPALWIVDDRGGAPLDDLWRRAAAAGHLRHADRARLDELPPRWLPVIYASTHDDEGVGRPARADLPVGAIRVLCRRADAGLSPDVHGDWDLCIALGHGAPVRLPVAGRGWLVAPDIDRLFHAIDIRVKLAAAAAVESFAESAPDPDLRASIVIATTGGPGLEAAVRSALAQRLKRGRFEVIVVDNRPREAAPADALGHWGESIRIVAAPVPGVSAARNAGLGAARGDLVAFLDDDAVARDGWLEALCRAFDEHPALGVAGGPVILRVPEPRPAAFTGGWASTWSDFRPRATGYHEVDAWTELPWGANWAARRAALAAVGGFPTTFGRGARGAGGGEELMAAELVKRLGYRVAIVPQAIVDHRADPARFTLAQVRETMAARHVTAWRARRDLLDPRTPGIASTLARLVFHHVDFRVRGWPHLAKDVAYRKRAQVRLLRAQWRDRTRGRR